MVDIIVDFIAPDTLRLTLARDAMVIDTLDQTIDRNADLILLTGVDKLLQGHKIDKSALRTVQAGQGIDKNSSLYRMVTSFASAVEATRKG